MSKPMTESRLAEYDKLNENLISDYINEQNAPINCLHFRDVIAEVRRLRKAIEDVRHKGYCATVKHVCKGIEIEKGVFSGCAGLSDCPECNGVKHTCSCGIDDWKDSVLNNNRNALEKP